MNSYDQGTRPNSGAKKMRKTSQLCKQVYVALCHAMGSLSEDALLDVTIESVEPAPDASRLQVTLVLSNPSREHAQEVYGALERARGALRAGVAVAITRKRAPELAFAIRASEEARS